MTKVAEDYTFEINRARARLGTVLMLLVLVAVLAYAVFRGLSWGGTPEESVVWGLTLVMLLLASIVVVRHHFVSLGTAVTRDGVVHQRGVVQGQLRPSRLVPWDEIARVTVTPGLFGSPDFVIETRGSGSRTRSSRTGGTCARSAVCSTSCRRTRSGPSWFSVVTLSSRPRFHREWS